MIRVSGLFSSFYERIDSVMSAISGQMWQIGAQIVEGLTNGITSNIGQAEQAAETAGQAIAQTMKSAMGVHSPSTVTHEIGVNLMQGLANGINDGSDQAVSAAKGVAQKITTAVASMGVGKIGGVGVATLTSPAQTQAAIHAALMAAQATAQTLHTAKMTGPGSPGYVQQQFAGEIGTVLKVASTSSSTGVSTAPSTPATLGSGSGNITIELHVDVDGKQFYAHTWSELQSTLLKHKRQLVTLGLA
jgi:hypothetical protein